jgi:hypothetical protein
MTKHRPGFLPLLAVLTFGAVAFAGADVIRVLDFTTQQPGRAIPWLKANGFEFKLGFEKLNPRFENDALWLSTKRPESGLVGINFEKGGELQGVQRVRILWGVAKSPDGVDWEKGVRGTALGVMISFGRERLPSGLPLGISPAPYFICPFIGSREPDGRVYTGKYWRAGGRYISCKPARLGGEFVTEINVDRLFKSLFEKRVVPPITAIGIQMNTKDTQGEASAFIKRIELLRAK